MKEVDQKKDIFAAEERQESAPHIKCKVTSDDPHHVEERDVYSPHLFEVKQGKLYSKKALMDNNCCLSYREGIEWTKAMPLGTGAFSTCYQARDVLTGTLMAVKQISFLKDKLARQSNLAKECKENTCDTDKETCNATKCF